MAANSNDLKKKIESEQQCMRRVTNDDLVCKTCIYKFDDSVKLGNTSICEMYDVKPSEVLLGGDCDEYEYDEETG